MNFLPGITLKCNLCFLHLGHQNQPSASSSQAVGITYWSYSKCCHQIVIFNFQKGEINKYMEDTDNCSIEINQILLLLWVWLTLYLGPTYFEEHSDEIEMTRTRLAWFCNEICRNIL